MASITRVLLFLALASVATVASSSICLPDVWESEFTTVSPIRVVYGNTSIDVPGQRVSNVYLRRSHHHGDGPSFFKRKTRKTRLIADFKKGSEYIVFLNPDDDSVCGCVERPLRYPKLEPMCLPKDAEFVKNVTIGGTLEVSVYKVPLPHHHGEVIVSLTAGTNLPVSTVFLFRFFAVETKFYNVKTEIKDSSIFDIPAECHTKSADLATEKNLPQSILSMLTGRSILSDEDEDEHEHEHEHKHKHELEHEDEHEEGLGGCPSEKKMAKIARRMRTFAGPENVNADVDYDDHWMKNPFDVLLRVFTQK